MMDSPIGSVAWVAQADVVIKVRPDRSVCVIKDRQSNWRIAQSKQGQDGNLYIRLLDKTWG